MHLDAPAARRGRTAPRAARWTVLAGSLPPGAPGDFYAEPGRRGCAEKRPRSPSTPARRPSSRWSRGLPADAPDLLKPNAAELAQVTGADPEALEADPAQAAVAARSLVERGVGAVLATLGGKGAGLLTAEGAWLATPRRPRSS